jgi:uncharacterized protein (TIGR03086 family)
MPTNDLAALIDLDRAAVSGTLHALAAWSPLAAQNPTPCAGWDVSDLLAHMTVQQHGFARAVAGEITELADWAPVRTDDPAGAYRVACDTQLTAFAGLTDPGAPVLLPEVRPGPLPTMVVVGFHLVDNVVHAWDLARAFGVEIGFDDDVLAASLDVARLVPDEGRDRDGAAFAHRRTIADGATVFDQILLLLGRDPAWTASPPIR